MGYKPEKKNKRKTGKNTFFSEKLLAAWNEKRPFVYFVSAFVILMTFFYLCWTSDFFENKIQPQIASVNASISNFIRNLMGQNTTQSGQTIRSDLFSISVKRGCDAVEAMALFTTALLAFPMRWKRKLRALLIGISVLFTLNILRILSLFITGAYYPKAFDMMHIEIWQVLFIIFAVGIWILLIRNDVNLKKNVSG